MMLTSWHHSRNARRVSSAVVVVSSFTATVNVLPEDVSVSTLEGGVVVVDGVEGGIVQTA